MILTVRDDLPCPLGLLPGETAVSGQTGQQVEQDWNLLTSTCQHRQECMMHHCGIRAKMFGTGCTQHVQESPHAGCCCMQIRSYLITFLTYVAPGVSGALLLPAAWFIFLCPVRPGLPPTHGHPKHKALSRGREHTRLQLQVASEQNHPHAGVTALCRESQVLT